MNFFSKIKESAMELLSKIKKNRFLSFLIFLFMLLAVVFVTVVFSENPEWIFKLLEVTEKEKPKREALKFLGIGMMGVILGILMLSKKFSRFRTFQNFLITLIVLLGIVFVVVMFSENPEWIFKLLGIDKNEEAKKYEVLKFLGIGMGGILVALQALMSYKRAKAMEETVSHTEQGLRQERLKNAIEHLGHEKDSVRLGGAYELFHLAKEAKEEAKELRQTALDILCAYIRRTTSETIYRVAHESKPSEEVQSLLRLLFVREPEVFRGLRIELQRSWLKGADLRKACLQGAILTGAHLQKANLEEAHLQRVILVNAHLQRAKLTEAHLQKAELIQAYLQGISLKFAHLQGAFLRGAHLQDADLGRARLQGAALDSAYLQGAFLREAHLQGALLVEAHLQGADLRGVHLQGADLGRARLQGAVLDSAHLQGAGRVQWSDGKSFEDRIQMQIGKETDLSSVIFAGGLSQKDVDSLAEGLSDKKAKRLRGRLKPHIDQPISNELPQNSGVIIGAYTKEEAEKWIAEYKKATKVTEEDS